MAQAFNYQDELDWMRVRNIEFANYNTTFNSMNGKKIFKTIKKPQDLYKLPSEERKIVKTKTKAVYDPERAIAAYNATEKDESKWLKIN